MLPMSNVSLQRKVSFVRHRRRGTKHDQVELYQVLKLQVQVQVRVLSLQVRVQVQVPTSQVQVQVPTSQVQVQVRVPTSQVQVQVRVHWFRNKYWSPLHYKQCLLTD